MNRTVNLMAFGLNTLNYKNDKAVVRYFISKFNENFSLPSNNATGSYAELIIFANSSSKAELKNWAKEQMQEFLSASLGADIVRETFELATPTTGTRTSTPTRTTTTNTTTTSSNEDTELLDETVLDILSQL